MPGVSDVYATALVAGSEPFGIHAYLREGRVIKLEGNPDAPNRGRLSALAQSALQDLYDPDRVPGPRRRASADAGAGADADASGDEIEGFLERQITAANGYAFYYLLRKESEKPAGKKKAAVKKTTTAATKAVKKTTKKTKKKTTKKKKS